MGVYVGGNKVELPIYFPLLLACLRRQVQQVELYGAGKAAELAGVHILLWPIGVTRP